MVVASGIWRARRSKEFEDVAGDWEDGIHREMQRAARLGPRRAQDLRSKCTEVTLKGTASKLPATWVRRFTRRQTQRHRFLRHLHRDSACGHKGGWGCPGKDHGERKAENQGEVLEKCWDFWWGYFLRSSGRQRPIKLYPIRNRLIFHVGKFTIYPQRSPSGLHRSGEYQFHGKKKQHQTLWKQSGWRSEGFRT